MSDPGDLQENQSSQHRWNICKNMQNVPVYMYLTVRPHKINF